jgi:hypothetical protein
MRINRNSGKSGDTRDYHTHAFFAGSPKKMRF